MPTDAEFKMYFEHVDERFDTVVEVVTANRKKLDATFEAVGQLQEDVTILKEDVTTLKEDVTTLKEDMVEVKAELGLIRNDLKAKADRSELQLLEQRVVRLERKALAH